MMTVEYEIRPYIACTLSLLCESTQMSDVHTLIATVQLFATGMIDVEQIYSLQLVWSGSTSRQSSPTGQRDCSIIRHIFFRVLNRFYAITEVQLGR